MRCQVPLIACVLVMVHDVWSYHFVAQQIASISHDVSGLFHSKCLVLVHTDSLAQQEQLIEVNKLLMKRHTMVGSLSIGNLNHTPQDVNIIGGRHLLVMKSEETTKNDFTLLRVLPCHPRWLIFLNTSESLEEYFHKVYIPFNCEVLVVQELGSVFQLTEVYQVGVETPLRSNIFGTWSYETGFLVSKLSLYERRNNLEGLELRGVSMELKPFSTMERDSKQNILVRGFFGIVWNVLESQHNFNTILTNSTKGFEQYGSLRNGTWNGLVSMLVSGEMDVALNGFAYHKDRMDAVDYLMPITHTKLYLYVKKPSSARFQWTSFLSPFETKLWLVVLASILISGGMLATSHKVESRAGTRMQNSEDEITTVTGLFHILGLYCTQGVPILPREVSSRTVLLLAGLTSTVVLAAYSGALTSFITVQKLDLPYDTIQEYVDDPNYQLEMTPNTYWFQFNRPRSASERGVHDRLVDHLQELPPNGLIGFQKICDSKRPYGWIAASYIASLVKISCEVVAVPKMLVALKESMILTKRNPYTQLFKHKLLLMRNTGVLQRITRATWPAAPVNVDKAFPGVKLFQVAPIFAILGAGIACSLLLFCVERSRFGWLQPQSVN